MEHWIGGINAVAAALENEASNLGELLVEAGSRNARVREVLEKARGLGLAVRQVSAQEIEHHTRLTRHQGVAARCLAVREYGEQDLDGLLADAVQPLLLILDGVQDPHNLGACLRSAAAAGVLAVIAPRDRAVGITPVVRKAAAGAADRVPLVRVTNLARTMKRLRDAGVWIVGLDAGAEQTLYRRDLSGALAIAMGGEAEGMRRLTREHCDFLARIPMPGALESLNVSVAAGIALFEAVRQRSAA